MTTTRMHTCYIWYYREENINVHSQSYLHASSFLVILLIYRNYTMMMVHEGSDSSNSKACSSLATTSQHDGTSHACMNRSDLCMLLTQYNLCKCLMLHYNQKTCTYMYMCTGVSFKSTCCMVNTCTAHIYTVHTVQVANCGLRIWIQPRFCSDDECDM